MVATKSHPSLGQFVSAEVGEAKAEGLAQTGKGTVIWGIDVEKDDYFKLPRSLAQIGRYHPALAKRLQPRHIVLLLCLIARKFRNKPLRAYWEELAEDLGKPKATVRKWAYELKALNMIRIRQYRGRDPERNRPGLRNERNGFDFGPFVLEIEKAWRVRSRDRQQRKGRGK